MNGTRIRRACDLRHMLHYLEGRRNWKKKKKVKWRRGQRGWAEVPYLLNSKHPFFCFKFAMLHEGGGCLDSKGTKCYKISGKKYYSISSKIKGKIEHGRYNRYESLSLYLLTHLAAPHAACFTQSLSSDDESSMHPSELLLIQLLSVSHKRSSWDPSGLLAIQHFLKNLTTTCSWKSAPAAFSIKSR